jgi:hypothetical protein
MRKDTRVLMALPTALKTPAESREELINRLCVETGYDHISLALLADVLKKVRLNSTKLGWSVSYHSNRDGYVLVDQPTVHKNPSAGRPGDDRMVDGVVTVLSSIQKGVELRAVIDIDNRIVYTRIATRLDLVIDDIRRSGLHKTM